MTVLLMRLEGPMQSWGTYSRFTERDTGTAPSKSAVIGIIASAMGRGRKEDVSDLASLRMAVRVEREGRYSMDYHTALDVPRAGSKATDTVVSRRYYLSDACFLVFLEGPEALLKEVFEALKNPKHPVFLGRKSFPASSPLCVSDGLLEGAIEDWLGKAPLLNRDHDESPQTIRVVVECAPGDGEAVSDVPTCYDKRDFSVRHVRTEWLEADGLMEGL